MTKIFEVAIALGSKEDAVSFLEEHWAIKQAELDEYKAHVAALRGELQFVSDRFESGVLNSNTRYGGFKYLLSSTPAQFLSEVKAKAIIKAVDDMQSCCGEISDCDLIDYANKLKMDNKGEG